MTCVTLSHLSAERAAAGGREGGGAEAGETGGALARPNLECVRCLIGRTPWRQLICSMPARVCVCVCVWGGGRGKGARRVRVGRLDRRPHSNAHQMITQLSGCCILLAISWRKSQPPHPLPAYTYAIYDSPQRAHTHTETHTGNVLPTNRRYVSYPATRCWPSCVFRFTIE